MDKITEFLSGNKTYVIAALIILTAVLKRCGVLDTDTMNTIITVLLGSGLITLRMGAKADAEKALRAFRNCEDKRD